VRRAQRGVALLVVLWACTLLAILLGGYAVLARTEGMQARYQFQQTQAHYAAEAGVMRAIYALQAPRQEDHWLTDGRSYAFDFDGTPVSVSITSESGKVDLNAATPVVLTGLFRAAGVDPTHAATLAQAVVDWRSFGVTPDQTAQKKAAYQAAGRDYGPRNGPFATVEELQMVLGMTPDLYTQIAPAITIWSGRSSPDPATAPLLALLATTPGIDPQQASQLIANRYASSTTGIAGLVGGPSVTDSIRSEAVLADGTRAVMHATVRLQGIRPGSQQPFAVLRWQEGDGE